MASWQFRILRQLLHKRLQKQTAARLHEDITVTRRSLEKLGVRTKVPFGCQTERLAIGSMAAEWIIPAQVTHGRVLLYLHGGAYCLGSICSHRFLAGHIAHAAQGRVLLINYRLAPEHPFPAALEDATAAYRWLLAEGYTPEKTSVVGDSAGGGIGAGGTGSLA